MTGTWRGDSAIHKPQARGLRVWRRHARTATCLHYRPACLPSRAARRALLSAQTQGGPERCVVVLGTGRSGSTSLVDALNQMPHFFVRMEQEGAYWYLYLAWRWARRT